ncbi:MAG: ABC transporter ATP-binding protein [Deltaproteobacteria bacterium]|nr:ABC transporter ATP-binding protein [Deltaproteobacteria bacterium]
MLLSIENLTVEIAEKEVLQDINLEIDHGETHVLFGKNGSGKTTLLMTIMGFSGCRIVRGRILFKEKDITQLPINERAKMGIGMSFQRPPTIRGLKVNDLVNTFNNNGEQTIEQIVHNLHFSEFMERDINLGFSGGEIKKSELLQLIVQNPELILLDEPESGVDLENIKVIGKVIKKLLQKNLRRQRFKSGLVITHTGLILNYLEADRGHLMLNGRIICEGNPREMFETIQNHGYEECVRCQR